jgi:hypothetical protein
MKPFIPDPKDVKQVLTPGVWIDREGNMHFCAVTFCKDQGYALTPENVTLAALKFGQIIQALYPQASITDVYSNGREEKHLAT